MSIFEIDVNKCNRCGMCYIECPMSIIEMSEPKALPSLVEGGEERCIICGHCVSVCAPGAFSHKYMNPDDLVHVNKRQLPSPAQMERFLKSRRSIRAYKKKPVPHELLDKVIDIARYAPSGQNSQPVQWLVIEDSNEVTRLAGMVADWMRLMIQAMPQMTTEYHLDLTVEAWDSGIDRITRDAPHVIVAHALKGLPLAEGNSYIAMTYLELAAYSLGLGACWAGWFQLAAANYPPMSEALQLPEGHQNYCAMMLGYPKYRYRRIPARNEPAIIWR